MSPLPAQRRLPRPFPLTRRAAVALSALLLTIALALVWLTSARQPAAPRPGFGFGKEAVPVSVAPATSGPLRLDLHALGTITPLARVVLRAQVDGELQALHFTEGQEVRPGQLLAQIDPRPYHAALAVAEGELARSQALQANADMDLRRYRALARNDAVAGQKLDAAEAQARMTAAQVARDQARVDEARRQLALTRITAPQGGRIGLRRVDAGNHVRASDADGLTTLVQTRPISAVFSIPETRLDALRRAQAGGAALRVQAWDADERRIVAEGTLQALDNRIQAATGTVKLRAHFDNADEALFPNQFVNIRLAVVQREDVVSIPSAAVQHGAEGAFVFVIGQDLRAARRVLALGAANAGRVEVASGLAPAERVVVEGIDRLHDGSEVLIVEQPG